MVQPFKDFSMIVYYIYCYVNLQMFLILLKYLTCYPDHIKKYDVISTCNKCEISDQCERKAINIMPSCNSVLLKIEMLGVHYDIFAFYT